jgi:outer membrane protein assembly factor BamA
LSRIKIKLQFLTNKIYLAPDQLYRERDVEETYKSLMALRIFKTVNIIFAEDTLTEDGNKIVNCKIQLSPLQPQSFQLEPEITNSSRRLGLAGSVGYQHKNLFKGAENLSFKINVAVEAVRAMKDTSPVKYNPLNLKNTLEIGSEVKLQIPQFLLPFTSEQFIRRYNPSTSLSLSYRYLRRIDYIQKIANFTYGYNWNGNRYTSFGVAPFDINYVQLKNHSPAFDSLLTTAYAKSAYSDHMVTT